MQVGRTIKLLGMDLPDSQRTIVNAGQYRKCTNKCSYIASPLCDCDEPQTMHYVVKEGPLTTPFEGNFSALHLAQICLQLATGLELEMKESTKSLHHSRLCQPHIYNIMGIVPRAYGSPIWLSGLAYFWFTFQTMIVSLRKCTDQHISSMPFTYCHYTHLTCSL